MSEKRKVSVMIDKDLYNQLWMHIHGMARAKGGRSYGLLSKVVEEAIKKYFEDLEDEKNRV